MPAPPLAEIEAIERILAGAPPSVTWHSREVRTPEGATLPQHVIALGCASPQAPAVGFFGGVHGLERIGARVVIAHLQSVVTRLPWDTALRHLLERTRLVFMPVVNPGGMLRGTRANPAGVDLMRNAPVDALDAAAFMVGGQRLSSGLPWFRGRAGQAMQPEAAALCEVVEQELHGRPFSLALDCHSGFGMRDRVWFPFAHRRAPIDRLAELHAFHEIFAASHLHHPYTFEPQSRQYLAHGDLWDHLYLRAAARPGAGVFLPLTLEMGSWLWVRKNPRQLFSRAGIFNPVVEHREQRVLRRHLPLLDFALRAAASWPDWAPQGEARQRHQRAALARWYGAGQ
ncbi:MAG TPA: M14 family zinc carboxypeptidase [Ramlibacter sp.]|nr:M14 family zinc carboxypeptidase [Ramlibacter sp.]